MTKKFLKRLAVVAFVGVFGLGMAFVGANYSKWTKDISPIVSAGKENISENNMIAETTQECGIKLMMARVANASVGTSTTAMEETYSVTATIVPANADNQKVDMSVAWKDPNSYWASGKNVTDYVTITQTSEGSLTGILSCSQAFAEQIILSVVSQEKAEAKATATIDYIKRVVGCNFHRLFFNE